MVLDAGHSAKVVALEAAKQLSATWVILDRFLSITDVLVLQLKNCYMKYCPYYMFENTDFYTGK